MDDKKIQEIMKRYDDLPEDLQKALFSTQTSDAIFEVGKKHGLVIEKMGELADETGLVMLGMTKPNEYIKNLEKRLGVEVIKAKEIAEDINQKVFSPIRESLKKIHGITAKVSPPENLPVEPITKSIPQKVIMPPQPDNIKVGEIAKPVEPKVEVKPMISGRIPAESPVDIQAGPPKWQKPFGGEKTEKETPDIFLKKIPSTKSSSYTSSDPYKESTE